MDCSTPAFPVHHQLQELAQTHIHKVSDAIQPSHPLSSPSPPASVFPSIRVFSNESVLCIRWPRYWSLSFSISPSSEYSGLISFRIEGLFLDSQFYSTDCVSELTLGTIQCWFLLLCSKCWDQIVWVLQLCSLSNLFWLFLFPCISIQISGSTCPLCKNEAGSLLKIAFNMHIIWEILPFLKYCLPIHEYRLSLLLSRSYLLSLNIL